MYKCTIIILNQVFQLLSLCTFLSYFLSQTLQFLFTDAKTLISGKNMLTWLNRYEMLVVKSRYSPACIYQENVSRICNTPYNIYEKICKSPCLSFFAQASPRLMTSLRILFLYSSHCICAQPTHIHKYIYHLFSLGGISRNAFYIVESFIGLQHQMKIMCVCAEGSTFNFIFNFSTYFHLTLIKIAFHMFLEYF